MDKIGRYIDCRQEKQEFCFACFLFLIYHQSSKWRCQANSWILESHTQSFNLEICLWGSSAYAYLKPILNEDHLGSRCWKRREERKRRRERKREKQRGEREQSILLWGITSFQGPGGEEIPVNEARGIAREEKRRKHHTDVQEEGKVHSFVELYNSGTYSITLTFTYSR